MAATAFTNVHVVPIDQDEFDGLDVMQRAERVFIGGREVYAYDAQAHTGVVAPV